MKIIYLSDFNCPYSYIGLNRIKNAVCELNLEVEWEMKSFELEPNAKNLPAVERFAIKNGLSMKDAEREIAEIEKIAQDDDLTINYKNLFINSSKDAHRLAKYVQNNHPKIAQELIFKIFESNFIENENISNHDILLKIATDIDEALSNGITTVPYYFIEYKDERLIIPGVFEKEPFKIAFEDLTSGKMKNKTYI